MSETIYIQEDGKRRKATAEEVAQFEKDRAEAELEASRIEAETAAKAEARESAMAKLKKLGLTDEEIAALVP
jgi:ABC-type polar amino acid transport system ATPase subunit